MGVIKKKKTKGISCPIGMKTVCVCVGGDLYHVSSPFMRTQKTKKYIYKEINISHFKEVLVLGMEVVV